MRGVVDEDLILCYADTPNLDKDTNPMAKVKAY